MGTNSCVPFRGRGPRSGEGVLEGKNRKDTLKWSRPPIGGPDNSGVSHWCFTPYTLCHYVAFPSRGNEKLRREILESYAPCTIPETPPLVAGATTFPLFRGHYGRWAGGATVFFSSGRRPGLPVFPAHQGGCKGFIKTGAAGAHIHLPFTIHHLPFPHGRPPPPYEPSEPFEPSEPSRRKPRPS